MIQPLTLKQRFKLSRFIKGEGIDDRPYQLNHRRIFILPGSRGMAFVVLILLLLLVAFVYNNNLTYILAFLLASIFFISILHSYKSLAGLVIHKGKSKSVFAGQMAGFMLTLENPSMFPRINVHISAKDIEPIRVDIAANSSVQVWLYAKTTQRGWHALGPVTVFSYFPFGLFRSWSPVNFNFNCLVYPKQSTANNPFPEQSTSSSQHGVNKTGSDDFYGLSEYQNGDSIRRIHWKAYARGHGLFIKQYCGASSAEIWLDYQTTPGVNTEQRLSQLSRWVVEADRAAINYGFKIPGLLLQPSKGSLHYRQCLEALALFGK